jgi:hypothetical protein
MIFNNKRLYSELPSGPREKAALALAAPRESEYGCSHQSWFQNAQERCKIQETRTGRSSMPAKTLEGLHAFSKKKETYNLG